MNSIKFITLSAGLFITTYLFSQFEVGGEIRPRGEMRNGYKQLPDTFNLPAFFISQRTRLVVSGKGEKIKALISVQDVRVWGDELNYNATGVQGDNASIDLKEAWFEADLTPHLSIKVGRQEFKYGDQRLLADRNWNQNGMSYDALKFSWEKAFKLDMGFSYGNDRELVFNEVYAVDKLKTLNFIYFEKDVLPNFNVAGLYILSGNQDTDKPDRIHLKNTAGTVLSGGIHPFKISGSGYYQFGKNKTGRNVSAYLWNCNLQYTINKLSFLAGIDYLSGHNQASVDSAYCRTDHTFDLLYGARHRYYGEMDYFTNIEKNTGNGGLIDLYAQIDHAITDGLSLKLAYHRFRLQNNVADSDGPAGDGVMLAKHLANELDAKISWKIGRDISLDLGYAFLRSGNSLNKIQGISSEDAKNAHWIWMMCTFKPLLFSAK